MAFHVSHRYGGADADPPLDSLDALLDEVDEDTADVEHVGVGVAHESGWYVGVYPGWTVVSENVDDLEVRPVHLQAGRDRERVLALMRAVAEGDFATLNREPWQPGYRPGDS